MKTDNVQLTEIIGRCFDYSMDGRLSPAKQNEFWPSENDCVVVC
jgi:hypothetical protein